MSFWGELKRRNVFKVGAAYVIVAWLIVQVASTFFPILHLPEWIVTLVAFLLILGLPVALILAWAYEMTPEGVKLTKKVPLADSITHVTGRKLNYVLAGLIIVLVGYIVIDKAFVSKGFVETKITPPAAEQATPLTNVEESQKTIAVLPFVNRSSEKDQEYFVDGLSDEIITILSQIPDLQVTSSTSSFTFKGSDKKLQEIANDLGVAHILEGSVRKVGSALRITAQLIRAADDYHLWSETYDRNLDDIFAVQEDIATAVAGELKVKLGIAETLKQLGGTNNMEAYELFLITIGKEWPGDIPMLSSAIESIDAAIELDPKFALAYAEKALIHLTIAATSPPAQAGIDQGKALISTLKAIELESNLAQAHAILGLYRSIKGDFIAAELAIQKALELHSYQALTEVTADAILIHYLAVGRPDIFIETFNEALRKDPLSSSIRLAYILYFGQIGDLNRIENEYKRYKPLFGDQWQVVDFYISAIRLGTGNKISFNDLPNSFGPIDVVKQNLDSPEEGVSELRRMYTDDSQLGIYDLAAISVGAAYFHHPEFALEVLEKTLSYDALDTIFVWCPLFHDVRQLPQFKEFLREIGLVDYWEQFGWPDLCHPTDGGDFECD